MDLSFINEDLRDEIQKIEQEILIILDQVHTNRQYINKHFQNCMVNYFLRNLNFPLLSETEPSYTCSKLMNNIILQKYINSEGAIYLKLMNGYLQEIQIQGKLQLYRKTLVEMVMINVNSSKYQPTEKGDLPESDLKNNKEYQSEIWKKAFSLFLLFHSYNQNIKGIFEIWNSLFPLNQITRKRKQNINHVIVVPTRNEQIFDNQKDALTKFEQKQELQEEKEEDENEEDEVQQIKTKNTQFYFKASQKILVKNKGKIKKEKQIFTNFKQQSSDTIGLNISSFESENIFFLNLTQCSSNLHFQNNAGDISFLSSSENQQIQDSYDHKIKNQSKDEYIKASNITRFSQIQPTLPLIHQRSDDGSDESYNSSIQMIQKLSPKLKNEKKHALQQNSYSLGRKIIKLNDKNIQEEFPNPFQQLSKPYYEESIQDIQDSIGVISSSFDPINQIFQDQKNNFQS